MVGVRIREQLRAFACERLGLTPASASIRSTSRYPAMMGLFRYSATQLLVALVLLIFFTPFVELAPYGDLIESVLFSLVLLSAVLAVGRQRGTLVLAVLLVVAALSAHWLEQLTPHLVPSSLSPALSIPFVGFVTIQLLRHIIRAERITRETVCAGLAAYIMLGLLWMFAYLLVDRLAPGSLLRFGQPIQDCSDLDSFYFSFVTLTSVGYGDITPASRVTQMLAVLEAMTGMFFAITLIARLVSLYETGLHRGEPRQP